MRDPRHGQGALALAFMVGGTAILAAIILTFFASSFLSGVLGYRVANQAIAAASAGIHDAILELARNKAFKSSSGMYTLTIDTIPVNVTLVHTPGQVTITSDAAVSGYRRKLQAIVAVDPTTGRVEVISWQQLTL